ncbi:MAG: enoyl-CoA hydratase-related protein [Thermodesulfobacteriota bacterium]
MTDNYPKDWTKVLPSGYSKLEEIIYEKKYYEPGGIARITINRPDKMNAITNKGMSEICDALSDMSHDPTIGVGILTGAGDRAFCTGGDVGWEEIGGLRRQFEQPININRALRQCRKPVIAAINGATIGGGNHWAYFCDFAIASDHAVFGQVGPRVGSPADGYLVSYLISIVGAKKAREMWMLCRQYTAQEAFEMGLVNKVVSYDRLEAEVEKWCLEILDKNPNCIEVLKASFDMDANYLMLSSHFLGQLMFPHYLGSDDHMEGPRAFREKRKPKWTRLKKEEVSS